ncbi:MAG TPA: hypothetical protein VF584_22940 [Longimicrobium sp.]
MAEPELIVTGYDNYDGGVEILTLYLKLPTEIYARLFRRREEIEKSILPMLHPLINSYPGYWAAGASICAAQTPPANWRELAKAWLAGEGTNNQGRVRSDNIASRTCDGLLFRSQPEIHLYRALKSAGVSFAPLPVFVRGGQEYRRIEPDFVIVQNGLIAVVEVDGDTVHQETPVEAHTRTTMLVHEGAHVERVRASDCDTAQKAERCAATILATLARIRAAR